MRTERVRLRKRPAPLTEQGSQVRQGGRCQGGYSHALRFRTRVPIDRDGPVGEYSDLDPRPAVFPQFASGMPSASRDVNERGLALVALKGGGAGASNPFLGGLQDVLAQGRRGGLRTRTARIPSSRHAVST